MYPSRFNRKFNYPYVFLNDEPFSDEFKQSISALTNAEIEFGLVPQEMWSVPGHVNETLMHHTSHYERHNHPVDGASRFH